MTQSINIFVVQKLTTTGRGARVVESGGLENR
jgi:hypothetical protein